MAKHCFISRGTLNNHLANSYSRNPAHTCIKVFDRSEIRNGFDEALWGDNPAKGEPRLNTTLIEATQIQNICSWHGLAPRVYGIETVELGYKLVPVQFCEYIEGAFATHEQAIELYEEIKRLGKIYGFSPDKDDVSGADVIDGKLIDFQTFKFHKPYEETVKEIYIRDGKYGKVYYQNEPELGLSGGPRDSKKREEFLKLNNIDFNGKSVVDVGCAGGYFLRYADDHGAKKIIGLDLSPTIHAARNACNLFKYFNIGVHSSGTDGRFNYETYHKFDIMFFLSMYMHVGLPDKILKLLENNGILIFEKNGRKSDEEVERMLREKFQSVKLIGHGFDHGNKPIYICQGKNN